MSNNHLVSHRLDRRWLTAWLVVLGTIPLLSIYGRVLQEFARQHSDPGVLAWLIGVPTLLLVVTSLLSQVQQFSYRHLWHLAWVLALFGILPLTLPVVEERLHFLVFGAFGVVTGRTFTGRLGFLLAIAAAGLDECLQWALPDRVGDWRDVGFNLLAVLGGLLLVRLGNR